MPFNFDLNALMDKPLFQAGIGLQGTNPQTRPLLDAFILMQNLRQNKSKMELEREKQKQEAEYRQAQIEVAKANAAKYGEQVQLQRDQAKRAEANRKLFMQLYPQFGQQPGSTGQPPVVPQSDLAQPPALPAPDLVQPPSDLFPKADMFVANIEGGYVANDAGKGPTNYGINQRANPDINVKTLTPETASEIRKQRYWDALSLDRQPPETAMVAYDAAINQGQQYALDLIEKTGGDPTLMLYQRRQDYRKLAKSNPMYAKSLNGWEKRLDELQAQLKQEPATPALPPAVSPSQYGLPEVKLDSKGELEFTAKPNYEQQRIDIQRNELGLKRNEGVRQEKELSLRQRAADQLAQEKARQTAETKAKDRAAFDTVHSSAVSAERLTNELLKNPGFNQIFGRTGGLISPRLLSGDAMNAAASLETLKAKMLNDTLQAIRQASANGASGYGQLDKTEGENLKQLVATLERAQTPEHARQSLKKIQEHLRKISARSQDVYEQTYKEGAFKGKPVGTRIKRFGTLNGKTVIEYSNGEIEYAD